MLFFSNASLLNVTNSACTTRGHERGCRLPQRPRPRPPWLSLIPYLCPVTHTHTHVAEGVVRDRTETSGSPRTRHPLDEATRGSWNSLAHSLTREMNHPLARPWEPHFHPSLTKISSVFAGFDQLETEEVKVLIMCVFCFCFVWSQWVFCVIIKSTFLPATITPTSTSSTSRTGWRGENKAMDDGGVWIIHCHSCNKFLSCHWCLVPLSDHTPSSPPRPFPSSGGTGCPLAALSPFLFFFFCSVFLQQLGAGVSQRCGVLHACPVFLLAPLPAARRRRWGC